MDHIVYLDRPARALEAMRRGDKNMVGRAFMGRRSPYGKVKVGDTLYFTENDGKQFIYGRGKATKVYDSPKLTREESESMLQNHRRALWLSDQQYMRMAGKRYLVLVTIDRFEEIPRFRFTRRDFKTLDDWLMIDDISKAHKELP